MQFTYSPNIALNVRNKDKAVRFYRDVLGFALHGEHKSKDCSGTEMKCGPITFWISDATEEKPQEAPSAGRVFFEFVVKSLVDAKTRLLEHGCTPGTSTGGTSEGFIGQMMVDPYGMRFHLYQQI